METTVLLQVNKDTTEMITMDRGENNGEENNNWAGGKVSTRQRSKKKKAGHV